MTQSALMSSDLPPPPRVVPRWFFVRRMQVLFFSAAFMPALGAIILTVLGVIAGHPPPGPDFWLDRECRVAEARITGLRFLSHVHVNGRSPWEVGLEFTSPEGRVVRTHGYTFDDAGLEVGGLIEIEYRSEHPEQARPKGGMASILPYWLYPILGWPLIVGFVLLIVLWRMVARERRLLETGEACEAEVVDVRRCKYIHFGRRNPCDVHYVVRERTGEGVSGKDRTYLYDWAESLEPGETVWVVRDPIDVSRSVLWVEQPQPARASS